MPTRRARPRPVGSSASGRASGTGRSGCRASAASAVPRAGRMDDNRTPRRRIPPPGTTRRPGLSAGISAATIARVDYRSVSFWLETAGDDLTPRPALDGSTDADVAILGAGMTGLWTAFYLQRRDPSLRIVILERDIAGFGASGRNGAWCAPDLNISMHGLARRHGEAKARAMQQATYDAVDEV